MTGHDHISRKGPRIGKLRLLCGIDENRAVGLEIRSESIRSGHGLIDRAGKTGENIRGDKIRLVGKSADESRSPAQPRPASAQASLRPGARVEANS